MQDSEKWTNWNIRTNNIIETVLEQYYANILRFSKPAIKPLLIIRKTTFSKAYSIF